MAPRQSLRRFEEAALPHLAAAYNLARWLTGKHEDAEDIVQEAFLRAYGAFDSLRGEDARAWLLAIVRNTAYTWLKRNQAAASVTAAFDGAGEIEVASTGADPEALAVAAADTTRVREAVAALPEDYQAAIVLREFEGLSYKEIAAITGRPVGTVMSRLARGREWLKRRLTGQEQERQPEKGDSAK